MSFRIKYNQNLIVLLKSIFYESPTEIDDFLPVVKDGKNIQNLIPFCCNLNIDNHVDKNNGISLIYYLSSLFNQNPDLIPLFHEKCIKNGKTLYESLMIPFYLHEKIEGETLTLVQELIQKMKGKVTIPRTAIEFIFQCLSVYFKKNNTKKLNETIFLRHLKLLNLFYTDINNEKLKEAKNEENKEENEIKIQKEPKEIKNFIIFNGVNSGISLLLNKTSSNPNADMPTIENGFSFVFWAFLSKELLDVFFNTIQPGCTVYLVRVFIGGHHINLILKDSTRLSLAVDDNESHIINISNVVNYSQWNSFIFMIDQKPNKKKDPFKVIINGSHLLSSIPLPKGVNVNDKITNIMMFENFLGRVTSFMFFSFPIEQKLAEFFESSAMQYGFFKNKLLFRFFHSIDKEYYRTATDYKYFAKYRADKNTSKLYNINLNMREQNINNLICCFCPFTYDRSRQIIDDVFGNWIAKFKTESDAVNIYKNQIKDITLLGGMNNILPILELMLMGLNKNFELIEPNVLCEETLLEYLNILQKILYRHKKNIMEANTNQLFSSLALFFEKFPSEVFTSNVLSLLLEICKETFSYKEELQDSKDKKKKIQNEDESLNFNFISMILLNEKIISKFSPDNQFKLWEGVNQFFKNDYINIESSINVEKIGILLHFYDKDRYEKYCCKKHAALFGCENEKEIMCPEMNLKVCKLFEVIQMYIDKVDVEKIEKQEKNDGEEKDEINFYKLLSLDLSPCLQKKIIQVYVFHFINVKISNKFKEKTLNNLLKNQYFEITEYVLGVSLLDVRVEVLKLLLIMLVKYKDKIQDYLSTKKLNLPQIFSLISHNILPTNLRIKEDTNSITNKNSNNNIEEQNNENAIKNQASSSNQNELDKDSMLQYFNKKIYDQDINSLWSSLSSSLTYNAPTPVSPQTPSPTPTPGQSARYSITSILSTKSNTSSNSNNANNTSTNKKQIVNNNNLFINSFVISFSIDFLMKVPQNYFIDSFLVSVYSTLNNENIANQSTVFSNKKLYPWIIDTVFHFHKTENIEKIEDKELVKDIQKHSIQVLVEVFVIKAEQKDIEEKMNYLLEYSYFMKNKYKNNPATQKEIIKITRLILEKIMKYQGFFNIKTIYCFEFILLYKSDEKLFERSYELSDHHKENTFTEQDFKELVANKRDSPKASNTYSENNLYKIDESGDLRRSDFLHSKTLPTGYGDSPALSSGNNSSSDLMVDVPLIPDYIYDSINYVDKSENAKSDKPAKNVKNTLKNIWSDYEIYNYIIRYYYMNFWGGELICKKVKINYSKDKFFYLCKDLYKSYSDNKEYKNILAKEISKCILTDFYDNNVARNGINVLNINLILLCISIDICDVIDEREELVQKFLEFLVFCILTSINLNQTENCYNYIQKILYDVLGFGFMFLQQRDEVKYREIVYYMINPIVEDMKEEGFQGIKKIFGSSNTKKHLLKPTAVYKLFMFSDSATEKESKGAKTDDKPRKKGGSGSVPPKRPQTSTNPNQSSANNEKKINRQSSNDKNGSVNIKNVSGTSSKNLAFRCNGVSVTKNIFERTLNFYKNERGEFYIEKLTLFYGDNIFKEPFFDEKVAQEKKRINCFIKQLVPSLISEIKKFSNVSYLEEKRRRNIYKRYKKQLFSWNGFWSDKDLFYEHPEKLKLRLKNHFTKDMLKIVLTPILDQKYYLPKFSKFDINNLYNKNDYYYNICLDIDEILDAKELKSEANIKKENEIFKKNNYGFNYLECLYKNQFSGLWDKYKEYYMESISSETQFKPEDIFSIIFQNKLSKVNEQNMGAENFYSCCMVKPTHHIKGLIRTEKESINFTYCPEKKELLEKDPSYDKDMGACFGSTFKVHNKDKDKLFFEIKYNNIEFIFKRNYFYQETGVEIYTYDHKSYFFNFITNQILMKFINDILQHEQFRNIKCQGYKKKRLLGYGKLFNVMTKKKSYHVTYKIEEWQNNNISNLGFLMWCNIFAGRSYNDLTQYPVMPWLITNYENEEIKPTENLRNLSVPVGMLDINNKAQMRKETFLDFYETLKNDLKEANPDFNYAEFLDKLDEYLEHYKLKKTKKNSKEKEKENNDAESIDINQIPFIYGSHYSNPTYVSHYLTRLFPFASISIEIHGDKFDDPNRMFFSLKRTFETASTLKDDVRELIPEFYSMPEIFLNKNNFNLSQDRMDSEGKAIVINNVELPPWSKNNAVCFTVENRKFLESYDLKINKWIDLIFGVLQKGPKAEENHNLFMLNTYEDMVNIENIKDDDERNALMRLVEVGVTPRQIFNSETKGKIEKNSFLQKSPVYSLSKGAFLSESTELKCFVINSHKYSKLIFKLFDNKKFNKEYKEEAPHQIIKMKTLNQNELKIISNTNYWFNLKFNRNDNNYLIEETSLKELTNISSKYACTYQMSLIQTPIIIYGNNKYMIKGGFWDGRIEINTLPSDSKEETVQSCFVVEEGPIVVMQMDKEEKVLICGTKLGYILCFKVDAQKLTLFKKILCHSDEISSISINDNLNMMATSSLDGYVSLYLLPNFVLIRSFKVFTKYVGNMSDDEDFLYADNVFLSSSPLPCLCLYISSKKIFRTFTVNGEFIAEVKESDGSNVIKCPIVFNNLSFFEFLIYGTNDGFVKIRRFPDMNLINSFKPFESQEIVSIELSPDKRYCYAWSEGDKIVVIKDISVNDPVLKTKK